jgi:predicted GNAT family acetyltransferase
MTTTVVANEDEDRYEIFVDGELAGYTEARVDGDVVLFPHTQIESQHEGQGLASQLIREALDDVRSKGLRVIATCPFVRRFIQQHPEYQDLLVEH